MTCRRSRWLLQGFGGGIELDFKPAAPCEGPGQLTRPDLKTLWAITRIICSHRAIRINYLSLFSGGKRREIVPLVLADNSLRWHVRAFGRERSHFSDFMLTCISKVEKVEGEVVDAESLAADEQWARIVEMELAPQPGVKQPKAIGADYGMQEGVSRIKSRAALIGYVLRRWSVDASPGHHLDPSTYHPWLRNTPTLYGVESAAIAPGMSRSEEGGARRGE